MVKKDSNNQDRDDSDHDMLIQLDTKLERVISDIRELKDGLSTRVSGLEVGKLSLVDAAKMQETADLLHQDYEARIRALEVWKWALAGGIVVLQFLSPFIYSWFSSGVK